MKKSKKLVSIIVLCYNHEKYVSDCLQSILNQTYSNIEIWIIDNASMDTSSLRIREMLPALEKRFLRVQFVQSDTNLGICPALNKGIEWAQGDYIKYISTDDFLLPDAIERYVDNGETDQDNEILISNGYYIDGKFHITDSIENNIRFYEEEFYLKRGDFERIFWKNKIMAPTAMIRRSTFEKFGLFDENIPYEDWNYWLHILLNNGKFKYIHEPLVAYRIHDSSTSNIKKGSPAVRKRFLYDYNNSRLIIRKYISYISKELYVKRWKEFFYKYLGKAIALGLYSELITVCKDAKQEKLPLLERIKFIKFWGVYSLKSLRKGK